MDCLREQFPNRNVRRQQERKLRRDLKKCPHQYPPIVAPPETRELVIQLADEATMFRNASAEDGQLDIKWAQPINGGALYYRPKDPKACTSLDCIDHRQPASIPRPIAHRPSHLTDDTVQSMQQFISAKQLQCGSAVSTAAGPSDSSCSSSSSSSSASPTLQPGSTADSNPDFPYPQNPNGLTSRVKMDSRKAKNHTHIVIPISNPISGLGYLSDATDGRWECQHLIKGTARACGAMFDTARQLATHFHRFHIEITALIPAYWHPCDECEAFCPNIELCTNCGHRRFAATDRWLCAYTVHEPAEAGSSIFNLGPCDPEGGDEGIFGWVSPAMYYFLSFDEVLANNLRPVFGQGGIFLRSFYVAQRVISATV